MKPVSQTSPDPVTGARIQAATDELQSVMEIAQLRDRVAELQRLLGEVYRNTNLRHHPELTGLADIVSKQLSA